MTWYVPKCPNHRVEPMFRAFRARGIAGKGRGAGLDKNRHLLFIRKKHAEMTAYSLPRAGYANCSSFFYYYFSAERERTPMLESV